MFRECGIYYWEFLIKVLSVILTDNRDTKHLIITTPFIKISIEITKDCLCAQ